MTSTRLLVYALPLVLILGGCASWQRTGAPPRTLIIEGRPPAVRLTRADSGTVTIRRPMIVGDSIIDLAGIGFDRVAVSDVDVLEVERVSPTKTVALIAAQAGAVVSVIALIIDLLPHYRSF